MGSGGYFTDDSMLRRVQREHIMVLSGPRTLLMQAAHPVAFAGFFAHTGALEDPYQRLQRTAHVLGTIGFGTREAADRATRRVRAMHARVHGTLPEAVGRFAAGTPYAGDDPVLLLWVLACLVDSNLLVRERYVGALSPAEREAYWRDFRVVGRLFGLADDEMPGSIDDFDAYMEAMLRSGDLHVGPLARELAVEVVMKPPVAPYLVPLRELANQVTVGLLPREVRRLYGFAWDPVRSAAVRGSAEYVRRVLLPLVPRNVRTI